MVLFFAAQGLLLATDYQLQHWAEQNATEQRDSEYVTVYGSLAAGAAVASLARSLLYYASTLKAASIFSFLIDEMEWSCIFIDAPNLISTANKFQASGIHNNAFNRVLFAPMAVFTANPLVRIINRFSADQGEPQPS